MSRVRSFAIFFASFLVLWACSSVCVEGVGYVEPEPEDLTGYDPPTQIGMLQKVADSCAPKAVIGSKMILNITIECKKRPGSSKKVTVLRDDKYEFTLGEGLFGIGMDEGLFSACAGELRRLRIPSLLAFGSEGSAEYGVSPDVDLTVVVGVQQVFPPPPNDQQLALHVDPPERLSKAEQKEEDDLEASRTFSEAFDDDDKVFHLREAHHKSMLNRRHALIYFHEDNCEACGKYRPTVARLAKAFLNEKKRVLIAEVDRTKGQKELARKFGVSKYPRLFYVHGMRRYEMPRNSTRDMVHFLNQKAGTDRRSNGHLGKKDGRIAEYDELVIGYHETRMTLGEVIMRLPKESYYRRVAKAVQKEGTEYLTNETERLLKVISEPKVGKERRNMSLDQRDSQERRINIMRVFNATEMGVIDASDGFEPFVTILRAADFAGKTEGKHALVLFHQAVSHQCRTQRPILSRVAQVYANEGAKIVIGALDGNADKEIADKYKIFSFPKYVYLFNGTHQELPRASVGDFVKFLNKKSGTDRKVNGMLGPRDGRVPSNDALVAEYLENNLTLKDLIQRLPDGSYYRRVAESIEKHGADYPYKEALRLSKMRRTLKPSQLNQQDSVDRRLNVLRVYNTTELAAQSSRFTDYSDTFGEEVIRLRESNFLAKIGPKHAVLMFHRPDCEESCGTLRPIVTRLAKAFINDASSVLIGEVNGKFESAIAKHYGVTTYPTLLYVAGSHSTEVIAPDSDLSTLVRFLNAKAGTDRTTSGALGGKEGRDEHNEKLVLSYTEGEIPIGELKAQLPAGSFYRRVAELIEEHGGEYPRKEATRLSKLLSTPAKLSKSQRDSMQRRLNVLRAYVRDIVLKQDEDDEL